MKKLLLLLLCVPLMFSCEFFSDKKTTAPSSWTYTSPFEKFINEDQDSYNRLIEITGSKNAAIEIVEKNINNQKLTIKEASEFLEAYEKFDEVREIFEGSTFKIIFDELPDEGKITLKESQPELMYFSYDFLDKALGYNLKAIRDSLSNINSVQ